MKLDKATRRDDKFRKARHGMRTQGRSVFTIKKVLDNRTESARKAAVSV
jgi:hypothetical protein